MPEVAATNRNNASAVAGTLDADAEWIRYKCRSGASMPVTIRAEVIFVSGTGTVSLIIAPVGSAAGADGFVQDTFTATESVVVTPGGDCDVFLKVTAHTNEVVTARLIAGARAGH
jgi:hypothetical protein